MAVLVLNSAWQPLGAIKETDAIILLATGEAKALKSNLDRLYRSAYLCIPAPEVIIINHYEKPNGFKFRPEPVSNPALFARDEYTCMYCGKSKRDPEHLHIKLTRDHIVPKSKGGGNEWLNLTTACGKCNRRKDNRTPEEAGMPLLRKPTVPVGWTLRGKNKLSVEQIRYVENLLNLKGKSNA